MKDERPPDGEWLLPWGSLAIVGDVQVDPEGKVFGSAFERVSVEPLVPGDPFSGQAWRLSVAEVEPSGGSLIRVAGLPFDTKGRMNGEPFLDLFESGELAWGGGFLGPAEVPQLGTVGSWTTSFGATGLVAVGGLTGVTVFGGERGDSVRVTGLAVSDERWWLGLSFDEDLRVGNTVVTAKNEEDGTGYASGDTVLLQLDGQVGLRSWRQLPFERPGHLEGVAPFRDGGVLALARLGVQPHQWMLVAFDDAMTPLWNVEVPEALALSAEPEGRAVLLVQNEDTIERWIVGQDGVVLGVQAIALGSARHARISVHDEGTLITLAPGAVMIAEAPSSSSCADDECVRVLWLDWEGNLTGTRNLRFYGSPGYCFADQCDVVSSVAYDPRDGGAVIVGSMSFGLTVTVGDTQATSSESNTGFVAKVFPD